MQFLKVSTSVILNNIKYTINTKLVSYNKFNLIKREWGNLPYREDRVNKSTQDFSKVY